MKEREEHRENQQVEKKKEMDQKVKTAQCNLKERERSSDEDSGADGEMLEGSRPF